MAVTDVFGRGEEEDGRGRGLEEEGEGKGHNGETQEKRKKIGDEGDQEF